MDTLQVIALIVVALIVLAVIMAFRKRIVLTLKAWGLDLNLEAENESPAAQTPPLAAAASGQAGVRVHETESTGGGLLIEEGRSETGPGIDVQGVKVKDDLIIGKGQSGTSPKADPPA
jgi:hypothetical protein